MKTMILMAALLTASIAQAAEPDDTVRYTTPIR